MDRNHPKRDALLLLLLDGWRFNEVAKELGVSYEIVRQWKADPSVQTDLARLREERMQSARELGKAATEEAVRVLFELLEHADPDVRMRAANSILDRFGAPKTSKVESEVKDSRAPEVDRARLLLEIEAKAQGGQNGDP